MKRVKTADLTGAALDWAVAKCLGVRVYIGRYEHTMTGSCLLDAELVDMNTDGPQELKFSRDWAQGGPIIERGEIDLYCHESPKTGGGWWVAEITGTKAKAKGNTPLIAAMRCYVASKLGDEVEIPEELLP